MSSNRLCYDSCAYQTKLQQSTSPLDYALYAGKFENVGKCRIEFGTVGGNAVSLYAGNLVDLESDLRGQTRLNSQCPATKFNPAKTAPMNLHHQPSCQMQYFPKVDVQGNMGGKQCNYSKWN